MNVKQVFFNKRCLKSKNEKHTCLVSEMLRNTENSYDALDVNDD